MKIIPVSHDHLHRPHRLYLILLTFLLPTILLALASLLLYTQNSMGNYASLNRAFFQGSNKSDGSQRLYHLLINKTRYGIITAQENIALIDKKFVIGDRIVSLLHLDTKDYPYLATNKDNYIPDGYLNLGIVVDLSGRSASDGQSAITATQIAVDQINEAGGIKNFPVRLLIKDSAGNPQMAAATARYLVAGDKEINESISVAVPFNVAAKVPTNFSLRQSYVSAIIAPTTSNETIAVANAIEDKTLLFTYTANAEYLTLPPSHTTSTVFQIGPNNVMEGKAHALDLARSDYRKYFILGTGREEDRAQANSFKKWLKTLKPEVEFSGEFWQPTEDEDYSSVIDRVLAAQPQMVYSTLKGQALVNFTRQAVKTGFFNKVAFTASYDVGVLQELKRDMVPGVRAYFRAPFFTAKTPQIKDFVERYFSKTGLYPSDSAVLAYGAVKVWAQMAETAESLSVLDMMRRGAGLRFEFLVPDSYIRGYDRQSSFGSFIGETKWDDNYGFMTYDNVRYIPAENLWNSIEEIKKKKVWSPEVYFGVITDLTGEFGGQASESLNALQIATEQLNSDKGILGSPVKLIVRDSESNPQKAAEQTELLITSERLSVLFGPVSSSVAVSITEIAKKYAMPVIFHYANSERLTINRFNEQIIQIGPSTYIEGRLQAMDLARESYSSYYIIGPRIGTAYEESLAFKEWLKRLRPDVNFSGELWLPAGETDYSSVINTMLAAKPDLVYSLLTGDDLVRFTRQAINLKFFDNVAFTANYDVGVLQKLKQDMPSGIRAFSRAPFFASRDPRTAEFVKSYHTRTLIYPSDAAMLAYESFSYWVEILARREEITTQVSRVVGINFESPFGIRFIRVNDHQQNAGIFIGTTEWNDEYGFMVYRDIRYLAPESVWHSPIQIEALRNIP